MCRKHVTSVISVVHKLEDWSIRYSRVQTLKNNSIISLLKSIQVLIFSLMLEKLLIPMLVTIFTVPANGRGHHSWVTFGSRPGLLIKPVVSHCRPLLHGMFFKRSKFKCAALPASSFNWPCSWSFAKPVCLRDGGKKCFCWPGFRLNSCVS